MKTERVTCAAGGERVPRLRSGWAIRDEYKPRDNSTVKDPLSGEVEGTLFYETRVRKVLWVKREAA